MDEEETFFMNKDYTNDTNQDENLIKALKIKELCENNMSGEIKKSIFTYFQVLIVLSERCVADKISNQNLNDI